MARKRKPGETTTAHAPGKHPNSLANLRPRPPWQPGQSGNPKGRPKGSRNDLTELFIATLHADFLENGIDAVIAARRKNPSSYLAVIAGLLPKQIEVDEERFIYVISDKPLSVEDWAKKYAGSDSDHTSIGRDAEVLGPPRGTTNGAG